MAAWPWKRVPSAHPFQEQGASEVPGGAHSSFSLLSHLNFIHELPCLTCFSLWSEFCFLFSLRIQSANTSNFCPRQMGLYGEGQILSARNVANLSEHWQTAKMCSAKSRGRRCHRDQAAADTTPSPPQGPLSGAGVHAPREHHSIFRMVPSPLLAAAGLGCFRRSFISFYTYLFYYTDQSEV